MDIKTRIEEVISQKGLTKKEVSERMGKFNQAFNSLITNPKWDTIELVAQAIGITTEQLLFGSSSQDSAIKNAIGEDTLEDGSANNNHGEISQTIGMLLCPHCGKGIKFIIKKL